MLGEEVAFNCINSSGEATFKLTLAKIIKWTYKNGTDQMLNENLNIICIELKTIQRQVEKIIYCRFSYA